MLETTSSTLDTEVAHLRVEVLRLREQLAAARQANHRSHALLTHLRVGMVVCAEDGSIRYANPKARELLGVDELEGQDALSPIWELHHPDGRVVDRAEHPIARALLTRQPVLDCHLSLKRPDGSLCWMAVNALPILDEAGNVREISTTFLDLTHDAVAMRAAALARETMTRFVRAAPLGICVTDEHGVFEQVNPHYCGFYGYTEAEMLGRHFSLVVPEDQRQTLSRLHDQFIREGVEIQGEWKVRTRQGETRTILADAVRITGDDGRPRKVTFIVDISPRIQLEQALLRSNEELRHLAITDGLTGLCNRRHITGRLEQELGRAERYQTPLSIFLFDLDHFKRINDVHGHAVGDEVLVAVAGMLRHELRDVDLLGRYGGEEFLVVLPNVDHAAARAVAERLRLAIRELRFGPPDLRVTLSGGVAQALAEESTEHLVRRADMRLYSAKGAGRDQVCG
jgi:diguanylate cyclase (GGDEF)-like protein/PAS domain S-box-containing protein